MLNIKKFTFNPVGVNAYLLWDATNEAVLIDPACFYKEEEETLSRFVKEKQLTIKHLLNTHGHFDHLMGNSFAQEKWNLITKIHPHDLPMVDQAGEFAKWFGLSMEQPKEASALEPDAAITFGNSLLTVIHVPGHSPGSVAYYHEADGILIVGDILFEGSIGRTDLPGGNHATLISGIKEKLLILDEEVQVYPGHGNSTTIGREKWANPFLG